MAPLTQFFTNLIGRSIYGEIITGHISFVETYARTYSATVLYLTSEDQVVVHATSRDLCPNGAPEGGSHRCFGDHSISIAGCTGLIEFWQRLVAASDPAFAKRYPGASVLKLE